jgi:hypothetical protein
MRGWRWCREERKEAEEAGDELFICEWAGAFAEGKFCAESKIRRN